MGGLAFNGTAGLVIDAHDEKFVPTFPVIDTVWWHCPRHDLSPVQQTSAGSYEIGCSQQGYGFTDSFDKAFGCYNAVLEKIQIGLTKVPLCFDRQPDDYW